MHALLNGVIVI